MSRRAFLRLLPLPVLLTTPGAARAQRPARTPARVGWLSYVGQPDPGLEHLRAGLKELGHVEGRSYVVVPRFAGGDFTRLPGLVEELAGENLDVLVTRGPSTDFAKPIRDKVPVVFAYSGDPVRIPQELATMLEAIRTARPDAMIVFPDSLTLVRRKEIAEFANRATENFKTLAKFTDRILKGAGANTLPIAQVSRIGLTLNMGAVRSMGLTVPPAFLVRADRVIE